jgi:RNA polymerase sigma-70 factor (ECF subfamily)
MGGNVSEAEDAFSRASLLATEKYARYAERLRNPHTWLARLFINTCLSVLRERQRQPWARPEDEECLEVAVLESPEDRFARQRLAHLLCQRIDELPERLRSPVELRLVHEHTYPDIARRLRISEVNARKRVQQGRALLRRGLEPYLAAEREP